MNAAIPKVSRFFIEYGHSPIEHIDIFELFDILKVFNIL